LREQLYLVWVDYGIAVVGTLAYGSEESTVLADAKRVLDFEKGILSESMGEFAMRTSHRERVEDSSASRYDNGVTLLYDEYYRVKKHPQRMSAGKALADIKERIFYYRRFI
jgi:hypothetical protein